MSKLIYVISTLLDDYMEDANGAFDLNVHNANEAITQGTVRQTVERCLRACVSHSFRSSYDVAEGAPP